MMITDSNPLVMGILNVSADSFYSHSICLEKDNYAAKILQMVQEGADIIDIGGESTRPFSLPVSLDEERSRVTPALHEIARIQDLSEKKVIFSIDTQKADIARLACEKGVRFINSIAGFHDRRMVDVALEFDVPICLMHMQKQPESMQVAPTYPLGVVEEVSQWFDIHIERLLKWGVKKNHIILDPGIGFGKTIEDNLLLIRHLKQIKKDGCSLLLGVSRKSFMQKILNLSASEVLSTTLAVNTIGLENGADIVRVHDVKEHRQIADFFKYYQKVKSTT